MPTSAAASTVSAENSIQSVAGVLLRAAQHHPQRGLLIASGDRAQDSEFVSYPDLLAEVRHMLGGLRARMPATQGKVVLLLERPRQFIPVFWACVLGGYIPCPLAYISNDEDRWVKHVAHVDAVLDRPLFISSGAQLDTLPASVKSASLDELRNSAAAERIHVATLEDAAILMLTSGSTGNSKAVELTHGNLLASLAGRAERQQLTASDVTFNWIAFDHVAALLESHMIALYVGATQLHAEPAAVLTDPLQFLRLIDRHRVSVAFAPNFLLGQVNVALTVADGTMAGGAAPSVAVDLSGLRRIVTGGEANVVETGRRFLELLAPHGLARTVLWPAFGMTETCAASVYSKDFPDVDADQQFASVGFPIAGMEMRIVDERGQLLPAGEAGELQLSGPVIFNRYYNNEEATRSAFTADGWFRSGDLGRVEDGRLRLVARSKDSIIVNGVNYFSHDLEKRLENLSGIEGSFIAAFPTRPAGADTEQLVVTFAVTEEFSDDAKLHQLVVAVRNTTIMLWGFRPALIVPLPKVVFPKTSLGKIQRSLLRKRLEAGDLAEYVQRIADIAGRQVGPHVAAEGPVEVGIAKVFADVLMMDPAHLSVCASFFDLGGTSLDILKLSRALQRFGLNATLPMVLLNPTVRSLAARATAGEGSQPHYDPLIPLQTTGGKTPLFCVHPGNGEVFVLTNVAKYFLNDRPFYALRPRGFNEGEEHFSSVAETVGTYVDAIIGRQPEGPYAIAGYSMGCQIAFEIAKELEARGRVVAFLGCIDYWPAYQLRTLDFNMATGLALVLDLISFQKLQELNKVLRPQLPGNDVCEYVLSFADPQRLAELDLDIRKFSVWARVAHAMETMLFAHQASGSVKAMTIFCSEGTSSRYAPNKWNRQTWREQLNHWNDFVRQPRYVEVEGNHHVLMGPKYVANFQAQLRAEIDRAFASYELDAR